MLIDKTRLPELHRVIFGPEHPDVYEAYSAYGREPEEFISPEQLDDRVLGSLDGPKPSFDFAIWYPGCGGRIEKERIQLAPEKRDGHNFRYSLGGWGIFRYQGQLKTDRLVDCRIAVNSHKRASTWAAVYSEWLAVEAWNWPEVEKQERRLLRKFRSFM